MADEKQDRGPWTVMARYTPDGTEQRIGLHDDLEDAVQHADDLVDAGRWAEANVYDREQKNVHTAGNERVRSEPEEVPEPPSAA